MSSLQPVRTNNCKRQQRAVLPCTTHLFTCPFDGDKQCSITEPCEMLHGNYSHMYVRSYIFNIKHCIECYKLQIRRWREWLRLRAIWKHKSLEIIYTKKSPSCVIYSLSCCLCVHGVFKEIYLT